MEKCNDFRKCYDFAPNYVKEHWFTRCFCLCNVGHVFFFFLIIISFCFCFFPSKKDPQTQYRNIMSGIWLLDQSQNLCHGLAVCPWRNCTSLESRTALCCYSQPLRGYKKMSWQVTHSSPWRNCGVSLSNSQNQHSKHAAVLPEATQLWAGCRAAMVWTPGSCHCGNVSGDRAGTTWVGTENLGRPKLWASNSQALGNIACSFKEVREQPRQEGNRNQGLMEGTLNWWLL